MVDINDLPINPVELATANMNRPNWCPFVNSCVLVERMDYDFEGERYENDDGPFETCLGAWFGDEFSSVRHCVKGLQELEPVSFTFTLAYATHYLAALARSLWRASDISALRAFNEED